MHYARMDWRIDKMTVRKLWVRFSGKQFIKEIPDCEILRWKIKKTREESKLTFIITADNRIFSKG